MSRPSPTARVSFRSTPRARPTWPAASLAGEERQGHPQAPPRHADLVDGLLLSRHGPGQLPEDAFHPVVEEQRGPIVGGEGGAHGSVTGRL